jgi:GTP:adenosylcobinamide-phosphate guanylyltransferase
MDAIVTAGGVPMPDDPLYSYSNGESKALIDVAGKPMVQWVLDALSKAKTIDRVVLVGLTARSGVTCDKPLTFLTNQGKMLDNMKAGVAKALELNPEAEYVLFVSSDIPAITGEMVDWVVNTCLETDDDAYYNVIQREAMEDRFPGSKRTYTRLKDMQVCGGDMNVARVTMVEGDSQFWEKVINSRKSPLAQAGLIGIDTLFQLLFRTVTLEELVRKVCQRLSIRGRGIVCPYPEVGMDIDKPFQLDILRRDLGKTQRAEKRKKK